MNQRAIGLLLGGLLAFGQAQAAFIADKIEVPVHAERFNQGAVLKTLISGASVEVMMKDGDFTRIRTSDNVMGWVESRFVSPDKPVSLEYLELLGRSKRLEADLKAAEEKLAAPAANAQPLISQTELEELNQKVKDAIWMKAEMNKARERAKELEAELASKSKSGTSSQKELEKLRNQNKDLETRLAAALLVSEQQQTAETPTDEPASDPLPAPVAAATPMEDDDWSVSLGSFFGSLLAALVLGAIAGMFWLDQRIRQRHGGFRLY